MDDVNELSRLRRRRNVAIIVAIVALLGSMAVAFPIRLARYRALKQTNTDLLITQDKLVSLQGAVREVQARLGEAQRTLAKELGQTP